MSAPHGTYALALLGERAAKGAAISSDDAQRAVDDVQRLQEYATALRAHLLRANNAITGTAYPDLVHVSGILAAGLALPAVHLLEQLEMTFPTDGGKQ